MDIDDDTDKPPSLDINIYKLYGEYDMPKSNEQNMLFDTEDNTLYNNSFFKESVMEAEDNTNMELVRLNNNTSSIYERFKNKIDFDDLRIKKHTLGYLPESDDESLQPDETFADFEFIDDSIMVEYRPNQNDPFNIAEKTVGVLSSAVLDVCTETNTDQVLYFSAGAAAGGAIGSLGMLLSPFVGVITVSIGSALGGVIGDRICSLEKKNDV